MIDITYPLLYELSVLGEPGTEQNVEAEIVRHT